MLAWARILLQRPEPLLYTHNQHLLEFYVTHITSIPTWSQNLDLHETHSVMLLWTIEGIILTQTDWRVTIQKPDRVPDCLLTMLDGGRLKSILRSSPPITSNILNTNTMGFTTLASLHMIIILFLWSWTRRVDTVRSSLASVLWLTVMILRRR